MRKTIPAAFLLILAALGVLLASAAFKKREFTGSAVVQICARDESNKWQIVDDFIAPLQFQLSIADAAKNSSLSTGYAFIGRSNKGLTISARLKNGAIGNWDPPSGAVTLDLPLEIAVDGKKADAVFKLTTESAQGVAGLISGRRAKINQAARTAQLAMVGSLVIPNPGIVIGQQDQIVNQKADPVADQKKIFVEKKELLIVISADGVLKALN